MNWTTGEKPRLSRLEVNVHHWDELGIEKGDAGLPERALQVLDVSRTS